MEMILFIGIQATGKSRFYLDNFYRTHVRINRDMLKTTHREEVLVNACLEAKQPLVIDNTNVQKQNRAKYIASAKAAGFRITGYFFSSTVPEALARNAQRNGEERVPDAAIWGTNKRLEPPGMDEGFDLLKVVRINEDGFAVAQSEK